MDKVIEDFITAPWYIKTLYILITIGLVVMFFIMAGS